MEFKFAMVPAAAITDGRLSAEAFRTLAALARHSRRDGYCFPEMTTIADQLGKSRQSVHRDLKRLEQLGYIRVHRNTRPGGGRGRSAFTVMYPAGTFRAIQGSRNQLRLDEQVASYPASDVHAADIAMSTSDVRAVDIHKEQTRRTNKTRASALALGGEEGLWRSRLTSFSRSGLWMSDWGDAPTEIAGDNHIPLRLLIEFGFRKAVAS